MGTTMYAGAFHKEKNVAHRFAQVAQKYPSFPAIITDATVISYAQLLSSSVAFAERLRVLGVDQKSTVAVNTGDTPTSLALTMATSLLGCRMVGTSRALLKQAIVEPTHFFRTPDAKGKRGLGFIEIDESWFEEAATARSEDLRTFPGYESADDIWLILHTSGTTGKPKFLGLTHRMVMDRTEAIAEDFPTAQVTCTLLFNPTSRPFYARAIGALLNACAIVESRDNTFLKQNGVDTVFCSPAQFAAYVKKYGFTEHFANVEISGAKLDNQLARQLAQNFDTIVDVYGASETNKSYVNYVTVDADGLVHRKGRAWDSDVEINDDKGNRCKPGQVGSVRVRNGYMVDGYIGNPEATARNFSDGWFYPGDLAIWGDDGQLDVIGRNDEVISFGGVKIDAQLIDLTIKSVPGIKDAVCFKNPKANRNEVIALAVFEDGVDKANCIWAIREAYKEHTGLPCFLGRIHEADEIPYSENGRPLREVCRQIVAEKIYNDMSSVET
jgi:acyl-coenzyme A synthetase/AMP-(fatty) acid ligase